MADASKRCRLCYAKIGDKGTDIFQKPFPESSFSKTITEFLQISLKEIPKCPRECCEKCLDILFEIKIFRGKILLTQETLTGRYAKQTAVDHLIVRECEHMDEDSQQTFVVDEGVNANEHGTETTVPPQRKMGRPRNPDKKGKVPKAEELFAEMDEEEEFLNIAGSLPAKPKGYSQSTYEQYQKEYNTFIQWKIDNEYSEKSNPDTVAQYLIYLMRDKKQSAAGIASKFAKLKAKINEWEEVNIGNFADIKKEIDEFMPTEIKTRQAAAFTMDQVLRFLTGAPNEIYLIDKVVFILTIWAEMKINVLLNLRPTDVQYKENRVLVFHKEQDRVISIRSNPDVDLVGILQMYLDIVGNVFEDRPKFLIKIVCPSMVARKQPVGIHTANRCFKEAAQWLKLPNIDDFMGFSGIKTLYALKKQKLLP